jgi:hypothetical protein
LTSIKNYNKLIEELQDLEYRRLYDEAKREDDGYRISFEDYNKTRKVKKVDV